jgi:hypothetical protein
MKKFSLALLAVATALAITPAAFASTVTYNTGTGAGTATYTILADTLIPSEGTGAAVLVSPLGNGWATPISGTAWIAPEANQSNSNQSNDEDTGYVEYQVAISAPSSSPGPVTLGISFLVDDWAQISLVNTTTLGTSQIYGGPSGAVCTSPGTSCASDPAGYAGSPINVGPVTLIAGDSYDLDFYVSNTGGGADLGGGPTGLDAQVSVVAAPEPSGLLLLGTGLLGLAFVAFRKAKSSGVVLSM